MTSALVGKRGYTGNPGGEIAGLQRKQRELFLPHVQSAVNAILETLANKKDSSARLRAAIEILDRIYGKVPQAHTGHDGGAVKFEFVDRPAAIDRQQWIAEYNAPVTIDVQNTQSEQPTAQPSEQPTLQLPEQPSKQETPKR